MLCTLLYVYVNYFQYFFRYKNNNKNKNYLFLVGECSWDWDSVCYLLCQWHLEQFCVSAYGVRVVFCILYLESEPTFWMIVQVFHSFHKYTHVARCTSHNGTHGSRCISFISIQWKERYSIARVWMVWTWWMRRHSLLIQLNSYSESRRRYTHKIECESGLLCKYMIQNRKSLRSYTP